MEPPALGNYRTMVRRGITRVGTGLGAGALLTATLLTILALGSFVKIPLVPFAVFDWLIRVLPARVVNFGLDLTIRVLDGLGLNLEDTAKTAEQVLAIALAVRRRPDRRAALLRPGADLGRFPDQAGTE